MLTLALVGIVSGVITALSPCALPVLPAILASDDPALAAHEQAMLIISAPDAHTMSVPLGRSSLVMSEDYAGAVLMGDTAPMPAKGTEYQIWMGHDGRHDGARTRASCPTRTAPTWSCVAGDMSDVSKVFVTTEPPGGSDAPSGPMIAEANLGA